MPDLFGQEQVLFPKGYPDAPGSGPKGMQCRHCQKFYRYSHRENGKKYSKCSIVDRTSGTDISMYSPACRRFIEKDS